MKVSIAQIWAVIIAASIFTPILGYFAHYSLDYINYSVSGYISLGVGLTVIGLMNKYWG
jgi:hypothetical protein